jgi:hypothetical protein
MKLRYSILYPFLLLAASCGTAPQDRTKLMAENVCQPLTQIPELLYYTVADSSGSSVTDHFVAAFTNQACERRLVYLEDCKRESAKSLLGFIKTEPVSMSEDEWSSFQAEDGGYQKHPHLSCNAGSGLQAQTPAGAKPELHIVSGTQGYSSRWMKEQGEGRLHYTVPNHCFGLSKKLDAIGAASKLPDPREALTMLSLTSKDENITLSCVHEKAPPVNKAGWSIAHTGGDPAGRVYMLRYKSAVAGQSMQLNVRRVDNEDLNSENVERLEAALSSQFNIPSSQFVVDALDFEKTLLLFDYCTTNCGSFQPRHFTFDGTEQPYFADPARSNNQMPQYVNALHEQVEYLPISVTENWTFETCASNQSLRTRFGFSSGTRTSASWFDELYQAARNTRDQNLQTIPCVTIQPNICRVELKDADLSASVSSGNSQISTFINRPRFGNCASATRLDILMSGNSTVTNRSWIIGNLPETVQKKWDEIRVIGREGAAITHSVDCNLAACDVTPQAAIRIMGDVPVRIESLNFSTTTPPYLARTIAVQRDANDKKPAITRIRDVNVENFNTGFVLNQSETYMLQLNINAYYKGIVATDGSLALIATLPAHIKLDLPPDAGTTPKPEPGSSVFNLSMVRGMQLNRTRTFVYGMSFDSPVNIGFAGDFNDGKPALQVWDSDFLNSTKRFQSQSYVVHAAGASRAEFRFSHVYDHAGLASFDTSNISPTELDFQAFTADSFIRKKSRLTVNPEKGQMNAVGCTVDDTDGNCYLQL